MIRLNLLQDETGIRAAATRLTDEELKEAENAFGRLKGCTRGLAFYLDYALANYRDPVHDKPVAEAAREYLALREAHHMRGDLSPGSSRHFAASFARWKSRFIKENGNRSHRPDAHRVLQTRTGLRRSPTTKHRNRRASIGIAGRLNGRIRIHRSTGHLSRPRRTVFVSSHPPFHRVKYQRNCRRGDRVH